jgi:peptidoglycan/xylan/chitin deacetylase (PgdA/CDA1 family)
MKAALADMRIDRRLKRILLSIDDLLAGLFLSATTEDGRLLSFLFHGLFENKQELEAELMDPQQGITVEMFRIFITHFLELGYRFVSPSQIISGLPSTGKFVLVTFDDGYFNNLRALPILQEFNTPAVFFISTEHVKQGKAFWWDVVFRQGKKHYCSDRETRRKLAEYKRFRTDQIESELRDSFGQRALSPVSDLDRPLTVNELREFSKHSQITIGNHTRDHAILTNYSETEIKDQIVGAQSDIREITGQSSVTIAYPNGNESTAIRKIAKLAGLSLGVGVWPGMNRVPLNFQAAEPVVLRRFTLWGNRKLEPQCRASRSAISFIRPFQGIGGSLRSLSLPR